MEKRSSILEENNVARMTIPMSLKNGFALLFLLAIVPNPHSQSSFQESLGLTEPNQNHS